MPTITVNSQFSEREEFCYSLVLISDLPQRKNYFKPEQLSKLVADIKKQLEAELKQYLDILPLLANESHNLSLFTNCRRLLLSAKENYSLSTEETISRVLSTDPDEMTARVFITADNNTHDLDFYRELITHSIDAVKYCLKMDISENLRSLLLSMLVEREEYTKKIILLCEKALQVLRHIRSKYSFAINKAYEVFNNTKRITENLLEIGIIKEGEHIEIIPVLLNPGVVFVRTVDGIKYATIGTEYEHYLHIFSSAPPVTDLETIGKIFSDTTRCEIIRILKNGSSYLSELARRLEVPTNSLHYHIQMLNDAQVIKGYYKGKRFIYELNPKFFYSISHTALQFVSFDDDTTNKM